MSDGYGRAKRMTQDQEEHMLLRGERLAPAEHKEIIGHLEEAVSQLVMARAKMVKACEASRAIDNVWLFYMEGHILRDKIASIERMRDELNDVVPKKE